MSNTTLATAYLKELEAEYTSSKKCLERIPESLFGYKPHPKSMNLGYLSMLVAEIPLWITIMNTKDDLDFMTFAHFEPKTTRELVDHFEKNFEGAKASFQDLTDEDLEKPFSLKSNGEVIFTAPKAAQVGSTLNHWVHHRGQLTVYMRLNEIEVPSIYGPSADDKNF